MNEGIINARFREREAGVRNILFFLKSVRFFLMQINACRTGYCTRILKFFRFFQQSRECYFLIDFTLVVFIPKLYGRLPFICVRNMKFDREYVVWISVVTAIGISNKKRRYIFDVHFIPFGIKRAIPFAKGDYVRIGYIAIRPVHT